MKIATLDLGTNTFQLLIAEISACSYIVLENQTRITSLGSNYDRIAKKISLESMERALETLVDYKNIIKKHDVKKIIAVGTSIFRDAYNSEEFIQKAYGCSGIKIEVIPGVEEAKIASLGVINSINSDTDLNLIIDIGGGSTEFSLVFKNEIKNPITTELGVVHLAEIYLQNGVPDNILLINLEKYINDVLIEKLAYILEYLSDKDSTLLANSGTAVTLALAVNGLNTYNTEIVNGNIIRLDQLQRFYDDISDMKPEERILRYKCIQKGRENLLIPGLIILKSIMKLTNKNYIMISGSGIKEGLIYNIK